MAKRRRPPSRPVQRTPLEVFARQAASACDDAKVTGMNGLFILDDGQPDVLCLPIPVNQQPERTEADIEALPRPRRMAAMATRMSWSPDESPTVDAWALIAVDRNSPAIFMVRRIKEDTHWSLIANSELPWFAASTAGSLREWLGGKPLTMREGQDRRLFGRVADNDPPPVHRDGKI